MAADDQADTGKPDGIPRWVKITGAVVAAVATVAGAFTGVYTIVIELEKQKTAQAAEESKSEQEHTKQLALELQEKERAGRERQTELAKQLAIEEEKLEQGRTARETARLELERQVREEKREDLNLQRDRRLQDRKLLLESISKLEDPENPHLGTLLTISRYVAEDTENEDLVVRALAAHAERSCSASELRVVFGTYREIGKGSFRKAAELNRLAFRQFNRTLRAYLSAQLQSIDVLATDAPLTMNDIDRIDCEVIKRIASENDSINYGFQVALLVPHWRELRSEFTTAGSRNQDVVIRNASKDLACATVVLAESGSFIGKFTHEFFAEGIALDLSEMYVAADPDSAQLNSNLEASRDFYMRTCERP